MHSFKFQFLSVIRVLKEREILKDSRLYIRTEIHADYKIEEMREM